MEGLIFLGGAVVLFIVMSVFMRWSERRDAKAAVRESQALRNSTAIADSFARQAPPAPPARKGGGIESAGS